MAQFAIGSLEGAPDIAQALGNMVVAWAVAEDTLVIALNNASGMDANMALAAYHRVPTFESRVKMIRAIVEEWVPDKEKYDKDAIDKAIQKLSKLAATRNSYVHGAWQRCENTGKIFVINMRAPLESADRSKEVKVSDIKNHTDAVLKRQKDLSRLIGDPTLREK